MLCRKEKEKLIISPNFKNSQLKNLEDMLDKLIKNGYKKIEISDKDKIILSTGYANNKNQLSLCNIDFKNIWDYLNDDKALNTKNTKH